MSYSPSTVAYGGGVVTNTKNGGLKITVPENPPAQPSVEAPVSAPEEPQTEVVAPNLFPEYSQKSTTKYSLSITLFPFRIEIVKEVC